MFKIGFIDYFLDEWHANQYPGWIEEATQGEMKVTHAYGMIDSPRGGLTTDQWCEKFGVQKCDTIDEIIAACDGLIVLSPDNTEMHLALCEKPLQSKKPVYVDKTFAPDEETAKKIFAFAETSGTPCYSTSALRYATEYTELDKSKVNGMATWGPNCMEIYSIHQLEPITMVMQARAKRVLYLPGRDFGTLNIEFEDGRTATMTHFEKGAPFMAQVCMEDGNKSLNIASNFWSVFIQVLVKFFKDGQEPVSHQETLNVMALREAGIKAAKKPGQWVEV
ncbi:MAG: hypothetical protein E7329_08310 [Clostridiales bacterium]|nr:hypothetical protein [Clostridiales bacterium]